jgi:ATP-dependent DNA ligase
MLATLADGPPRDEKNWTYELKYDGFRAVVAIVNGDRWRCSAATSSISRRASRARTPR